MKPESAVQIQCVDYTTQLCVRHKDLFFFSIPNEGVMTGLVAFGVMRKVIARIVNHFKRMGMIPGVHDFEVIHKGRTLRIEFKSETGVLSNSQKIVFPKIEAAGYKIYIIRTFEEYVDLLERFMRGEV